VSFKPFSVRCPHIVTVVRAAAFSAAIGVAASLSVAAEAAPPVKKIGTDFAVQVDNGWVIYAGSQQNPIFYNTDANPNFAASKKTKLKTPGASTDSFFAIGGIVFAPCPPGHGKCQSSEGSTATGVGLGFGEYLLKGGGGAQSEGGWVSDNKITAHRTNTDLNPGTITAVAVGTGGAYAVGRDTAPNFTVQALVMQLDSAGQTYVPLHKTFLPPLGGTQSLATNISKNAVFVTGSADDASGNPHAVYAHVGDTSWTDLGPKIPAQIEGHAVTKSRALAANDDGIIAGAVTVKEDVAGRTNFPVDIGFVYNVNTDSMAFFSFPGAEIAPLKVLPGTDVKVIGNLVFVKPKGSSSTTSAANHPFLFDGSNVTDFLTMTPFGASQPSFGCRVNRPNNLGEVVGTCVPDENTTYSDTANATAFYLNTLAASPAYIDINHALHSNEDATIPGIKKYNFGIASSIDDEDELTLIGLRFVSGNPDQASFLAVKSAYNP